VPQPLVLAIEPDLRQAAIVKRIVREKVLADVAVVDSREAAMDAMRTTIPDVLLLSALMSPRDEDELIAHLRTLDHADHLQTHTIPQLASTLNPIESPGPRGLLSAFRRKKEPEVAPSGCDPELFAEEIRAFLKQAADKKREQANARPDAAPADTAWRAAHSQKTAAPAADIDAAAGVEASESSSWSSPFEWKPATSPSPIASFELPVPAPPSPALEAPIARPEAQAAAAESLMSHLRPKAGISTLETLAAPVYVDEPVRFVEPVVAAAPIEAVIPEAVPVCVPKPPVHVPEPPVYVPEPVAVAAAPVQDAKIQDSRSRTKDSGLGIRDQRLAMRDRKLGGLASWARAEGRGRESAYGSDDLRGLLTGLAVPAAVVSVGYGRGCRIRRVRVPAARESQEAEAVGAVIISRQVLAEQRGLREQPTA
jgi:HPt (histidine-containing phosphotransfer) domain-containing protein